jgi:hypothetical protein
MSKTNDVLTRVKIALGLIEGDNGEGTPKEDVAMAVEAVLIDGTKVAADALEVGNPLFIVAEDGSTTPAPEGVHETVDLKITVDASGVIAAIEPKVVVEEEMEDTGTGVGVTEEPESEGMAKILMALESIVTEMTNMKQKMEEIEVKIGEQEEKVEAFSKAPGAGRITNVSSNTSLFKFGKEEMSSFDKKLELLKEIKKGLNK